MGSCFGRVEPFRQAGKYITGLMSDLPRKNAWTIAEHAGDATPDRMQRLLNRSVWDTDAAMAVVRRFVVEHLTPAAGSGLAVAALDETGQQKQGSATAGVKRQYMGCAGRVANGVNTVHCSYATTGGHALVGARIYVPVEQLDDQTRRAALGIPADVVFKTKPQLAVDITADAIAEGVMAPWCAGDEVYGRSGELREHLEGHQVGYVLRVGAAFHLTLPHGRKVRVDALVTRELTNTKRWQILAVAGSKGGRIYSWAWVATASPHHSLLIRKHRDTGELAYHYCYVPPGRPATLMSLVRVACLRWPVEEGFEFGKDHFGLDHSQVRHYTALLRHTVLVMAALAVCAVTAAAAKTHTPAPILPTRPDEQPPEDPGLIALTVAEIKRLFNLTIRRLQPETHHLRWVWWRRRHQARAKWFHHRTRLRLQAATT
ncbi:MAG TPA: IS701 family transposase [Micromonosporaceae bacterium]|nr:IS701 family transposase [Micromonosporaceae bacterium]HCU48637.1 IS701 family transposase [Micromonosporaceae bacterium]